MCWGNLQLCFSDRLEQQGGIPGTVQAVAGCCRRNGLTTAPLSDGEIRQRKSGSLIPNGTKSTVGGGWNSQPPPPPCIYTKAITTVIWMGREWGGWTELISLLNNFKEMFCCNEADKPLQAAMFSWGCRLDAPPTWRARRRAPCKVCSGQEGTLTYDPH